MKRHKTHWQGLLLALLLLAGCTLPTTPSPTPSDTSAFKARTKTTGDYFGTLSTLRLYGDFEDTSRSAALEDTWQAVKSLLAEIEAAVAVDLPDSDIARFNACACGEGVSIGAHTAAILKIARQVYEDTDGMYDPTVYPLVDLWGFTPRFTLSRQPTLPYDRVPEGAALPPPEERYIDAFQALVSFDGVVLEGSEEQGYTLTKTTPSVTVDGTEYQTQIDLGGIAKGYAVDRVLELLRESGWEYGFFSCGSSSMGFLKKPASPESGEAFQLGVRKPRQTETEGTAYLMVDIKDACLSSSGDYEHNYVWDGVLYCHIIDPRTGWPVNTPAGKDSQGGLATVTSLSGSAAYSDGLTTALCIMGPERAAAYLKAHPQEPGTILVEYRAGEERYKVFTDLPEESCQLQDPAYFFAPDSGF